MAKFSCAILDDYQNVALKSADWTKVERDLDIKDMAATIPGHGGLLDRFDSLILVAPAVFHYVNYFVGVGQDQASHVFTGG